jgi:hypothetical protein
MTSGRSDDCRSLRCNCLTTPVVRGKRRRSRISRALVRVPIQHRTMTSGRSDDYRSLRCNCPTTPVVRGKRRRSRISRALVRVPIQHRTMTSGRSDDYRSLRCNCLTTPVVRGKRRRSRISRALVRVPNPTPHYDKRFDPFPHLFGGKRTLQAPASVRSADCGRAHFTLRGYMAENGSRGLREEHGDD